MIQFLVFLVLLIVGLCTCVKGSSYGDIFFKKENSNKKNSNSAKNQAEAVKVKPKRQSKEETGEGKYWVWARPPRYDG